MPFSNPIIAGLTLIRQAIRSPNYVANSSGWAINKDGSAEFNNVSVRGEFHAGGIDITGNTAAEFGYGIHTSGPSVFDASTSLNAPVKRGNLYFLYGVKGIESVSVPNGATTYTKAVTFPQPFASGVIPHVTVNINNGAGSTARWVERAYSITNTGFTLFLFSGNAATTTGFNVDCTWAAVEMADGVV